MRRAGTAMALALGCVLAPAACFAQSPAPQYAEGQLLILVAPDYPNAMLAKGQAGSVVVHGKVRVDGSLAEPAITAAPPNEALEGEVRSVVRFWRFQPRVDRVDCTFRETEARLTIWFDIDAGKPKVTFSKSVLPVEAGLAAQLRRGTGSALDQPAPEYPWHVARNENAPELVTQVAYAQVTPEGTVRNVSVAPKRYYDDFRMNIVDAVKRWRFQPQSSGWCAELPFEFKRP
jgi:TonB family protein